MAVELKMHQTFLIFLVQLSCLWKLFAFSPVALEENKPFRSMASASHVVGCLLKFLLKLLVLTTFLSTYISCC